MSGTNKTPTELPVGVSSSSTLDEVEVLSMKLVYLRNFRA